MTLRIVVIERKRGHDVHRSNDDKVTSDKAAICEQQ